MSKSTISTYQLMQIIPDEKTAREYLEGRLWPDGVTCPECKSRENVTTRKRVGFYRCNPCRLDFTVRTGTVFERSKVSLNKWVYAMYLLVTARKGISSMQLAKEIGVTQKTAWFVLHRLREACAGNTELLKGIVEMDETYIGGKGKNMHANKKGGIGPGPIGKTAVVGMRERGGRVNAMIVGEVDNLAVAQLVSSFVEPGSMIHTDEHRSYDVLRNMPYEHEAVNHSVGEYSRKGVTTNSIESVWAVLKRGLHGIYHHASPKHLGRYVDEFTFRLNEGNVQRHTFERLDSFIDAIVGKRLTYERLTS